MPYLSGCCLHCSLLVDYSRGWWRKFKNVWEKSWILGRSTRPTQKNGSQNYHQLPNGKIDAWKFFHNNCHQYITVPTVFGPKWIEIPEQTGLASHWTRLQSVSRVHHITYLTKGNSSKCSKGGPPRKPILRLSPHWKRCNTCTYPWDCGESRCSFLDCGFGRPFFFLPSFFVSHKRMNPSIQVNPSNIHNPIDIQNPPTTWWIGV